MFAPGRWLCPRPSCRVKNWGTRTNCFKCKAKPQGKGQGWISEASSEDEAEKEKQLQELHTLEATRVAMPLWVCNYCGSPNVAESTHCYSCTTPSDEYLEVIRAEQEEKRQREETERGRSSRSIEREREEKEAKEKRARFLKYMDDDGRDRACMPQRGAKPGGQLAVGHVPEVGIVRQSTQTQPSSMRIAATKDEKVDWNSDDEAYDEFGRRKRRTPSTAQTSDGERSKKDSKSAKQQAALARLKGRATAGAQSRAQSRSPRR